MQIKKVPEQAHTFDERSLVSHVAFHVASDKLLRVDQRLPIRGETVNDCKLHHLWINSHWLPMCT